MLKEKLHLPCFYNKSYYSPDSEEGRQQQCHQPKKSLYEYYRQHSGEFESVETYVDNDFTGTDTNQDNCQKLIANLPKKANCVIVKDLSRLSRNYTDVGSLNENLFG